MTASRRRTSSGVWTQSRSKVRKSGAKKQRQRACADLAARLNGKRFSGSDSGVYAALASVREKPAANPADLGRRIMASRNPNYKH